MNELIRKLQAQFAADWTEAGLRVAIVAVALFFIVLALVVKNKWVLAGLLAYMVLP